VGHRGTSRSLLRERVADVQFACVEDQSWTPCTDQAEIDQFISDIVKAFEDDSRVYAYAYSNGEGLGDVWPAISNGQLT
jgi:hypothetical protein